MMTIQTGDNRMPFRIFADSRSIKLSLNREVSIAQNHTEEETGYEFEEHVVDYSQKQEQEARHQFSIFQTDFNLKSNQFRRYTENDRGGRCGSEEVITGLSLGFPI